jgi:two-component system OmpR family sensor kinase
MRRWLAWLAALLPAVAGLGIALLLESGGLANPLYQIRISLDALLLRAGLLLSTIGLGIVALWDLTQRRQQRAVDEERRQASEAHRRFVQRLDHELKNPLTAIQIELASLSSVPLEAEQQEALTSVAAQAVRLGRLVADLRKLAELETRPLEKSTFDVKSLLDEAVELAQQQPATAERRVTLSVPQAPWPLPSVSGDRDLIFVAVYNLLDNALKFTRPGDTIEVRASEDGTAVVIEVADTGLGVPDDELPHIFEELYRGQEARGLEGSGLGLALAKAVVERHGGAVTAQSRPGQGSVFSLRLPAGSL